MTTDGAGGVIYDDAVVLVVVALVVPLVEIASAWNAENEFGLGSAGGLTTIMNFQLYVLDITWMRTYLRRPFLAHNARVDLAAHNKARSGSKPHSPSLDSWEK